MRTTAILALVLAIAAAIAPPGVARAGNRRTASAHARRGVALYNLGRYAEAIEEFELAYTLVQSDVLLFDLAQSHRQLDHCDDALRYYRRFLAGAPSPELAREVRELVPKLEAACAAKRERPEGAAPEPDPAGPDDAAAAPPDAPPPVAAVAAAAPPGTPAFAAPPAAAPELAAARDPSPPPAPVANDRGATRVDTSLVAGTLLVGGGVPVVGAAGALWWGGRVARGRLLWGGEVFGGAAVWTDGTRVGGSPLVAALAGVAYRLPARVDTTLAGEVGALVVGGLDARDNPLARRRAAPTGVAPGARVELTVAVPLGRAVELCAGSRLGIWAAGGPLAGTAVVELSATVGMRFRR